MQLPDLSEQYLREPLVAIVACDPFICLVAVTAFRSVRHIVAGAFLVACLASFEVGCLDNMAHHPVPGPNHHILRPFLARYRGLAGV